MTNDDVRLSKRLSLWLRHRPQAAGLVLDAQGWAEVDAVMAALADQGEAVDWEGLARVVETNDKRRFELSADTARIRARQGHSIAVEGDWVPASPPPHLWHGTVERFMAAILKEGLKPMKRHHVHLSPDTGTAERAALRRGAPVILRIESGLLAEAGQPFWLTGNGVWLTETVRPEALTRRP